MLSKSLNTSSLCSETSFAGASNIRGNLKFSTLSRHSLRFHRRDINRIETNPRLPRPTSASNGHFCSPVNEFATDSVVEGSLVVANRLECCSLMLQKVLKD